MTAYVLLEIQVTDMAAMADYREIAQKAVAEFGGEYLMINARPEAVEGTWDGAKGLTLLSFSSVEQARAWYNSDTYAPGIEIAKKATVRRLAILPGFGEAV
ncbi:DUF1330 domain-containing protein [Streptomyces sp. NPDC008139]|uniref:DUF1330 domain-containing protein n=1 Tax=Streptomyces sp. NPDC008139 TaxID=3364814 RepID=UPI0036E9D0C5